LLDISLSLVALLVVIFRVSSPAPDHSAADIMGCGTSSAPGFIWKS
jgi:hypothetical protein